MFTDHFAFLKKQTTRTPKISIPSPSMLHFWGGRAAIDSKIYPDLDEFWDDAVAAWTAEIAELAALGCTYVQIDDVTFPLICDPHGQEALKARGDDPHQVLEMYASALNRIVAGTPKSVTLGMHMCRGNNRGKWMGSGGYEYTSARSSSATSTSRTISWSTTPIAPATSSRCVTCRKAST